MKRKENRREEKEGKRGRRDDTKTIITQCLEGVRSRILHR